MTDDKLDTSLLASAIMAKLTNHFQRSDGPNLGWKILLTSVEIEPTTSG